MSTKKNTKNNLIINNKSSCRECNINEIKDNCILKRDTFMTYISRLCNNVKLNAILYS